MHANIGRLLQLHNKRKTINTLANSRYTFHTIKTHCSHYTYSDLVHISLAGLTVPRSMCM